MGHLMLALFGMIAVVTYFSTFMSLAARQSLRSFIAAVLMLAFFDSVLLAYWREGGLFAGAVVVAMFFVVVTSARADQLYRLFGKYYQHVMFMVAWVIIAAMGILIPAFVL